VEVVGASGRSLAAARCGVVAVAHALAEIHAGCSGRRRWFIMSPGMPFLASERRPARPSERTNTSELLGHLAERCWVARLGGLLLSRALLHRLLGRLSLLAAAELLPSSWPVPELPSSKNAASG
jgi:hypothetical protein